MLSVIASTVGMLFNSPLPFRAVRMTARVVYTTGTYFLLRGAEEEAGGFTFDPGVLLNSGIVGLIAFAFFTDRLFTAKAYNRIIAERDKAESARDAMVTQQFELVIPLLDSIKNTLVPLMEKVNKHFEDETPK